MVEWCEMDDPYMAMGLYEVTDDHQVVSIFDHLVCLGWTKQTELSSVGMEC